MFIFTFAEQWTKLNTFASFCFILARKQYDRMTDLSVVQRCDSETKTSCGVHFDVYIMHLIWIIMGACCNQTLLSCSTCQHFTQHLYLFVCVIIDINKNLG